MRDNEEITCSLVPYIAKPHGSEYLQRFFYKGFASFLGQEAFVALFKFSLDGFAIPVEHLVLI